MTTLPTDESLHGHVLVTLLVPAARLAARLGIPLRDVKRAMELAYYRESRNRGLTMREMVELMSVSMRKVSQLSNEMKATYARVDAGAGTQRRIVSLLLAGPMTESRVAQALPGVDLEEVRAALAALVAARRVAVTSDRTPRYSLATQHHRLVREPWQARIDGLDHLLRTIGGAVEQRFFGDGALALARTVSFRARVEDLDRLHSLYSERVFPTTTEIDGRAGNEAVPMNLAIAWCRDDERA